MIKRLTILLFCCVSFISANSTETVQASGTVYICTGPKAYAYHRTRVCSGLNKCSSSVISVSDSKAKAMGRHRCNKCY